MKRAASRLAHGLAAGALLSLSLPASSSFAVDLCNPVAPVFNGDPCDPASGPLPMMPGLPLVLPQKGPTGLWSDGPPNITTSLTGDVDLAVRVGAFPTTIDVGAPGGSPGNPALQQFVAGGGGSNQGSTVPFTVFVTDGPGAYAYGAPVAGLQDRPLAVFAYADLDGDGVIGPTDADGTADNELEKQEALGHVGRQVGQINVDRFVNSIAVRLAAPASMGGLRVALVAGMYTGDDSAQLWTNGTPIFTNWPFFPPLDPLAIIFLAEANPPDPNGPNIIYYQPSEFLLPPPSTPGLVEAFVLHTDGSNPTTDQYRSVSGPAVGLRLFRSINPANFTASSRLVARPAPTVTGANRTIVMPAGEVAVAAGQLVELRLMPVDSLGNIADPPTLGVPARLRAEGGLKILAPDVDGDPYAETVNVDAARGLVLRLDTQNVTGRSRITVYDPPPAVPVGLDQALVYVTNTAAPVDVDDDGVPDDGDHSGAVGDHPCTAADIAASVPCDDNCPGVVNPAQNDTDGDGQGNCCDGTCVLNDAAAGCSECPQAASRFQATTNHARLSILPRAGLKADGVGLRTVLQLQDGQSISPDTESVEITIASGDKLHYFAQLPGLFHRTNNAPTWIYEDPTGAVGGILKAQLRTTSRGVKARFVAKKLNLVTTVPAEVLPNGLVLAITIGNDTFTRHLRCDSTLSIVRCTSAN